MVSTTAAYPYLGESKTIPNLPHLVIVPGTILEQWKSVMRIFLNPKAFDLFVYTTGQPFRQEFWSESGPFAQSKQPHANRIILATHSVCPCYFFSILCLIVQPGTLTRLQPSFHGAEVVIKAVAMAAITAGRRL
jgi:hypothetical protein